MGSRSILDFKAEARKQWTLDPCGSAAASGLQAGTREYYAAIDRDRYQNYAPWMPGVLGFDRYPQRDLLEIGFGQGTDLVQFARHGTRVHGVDLSPAHLRIAQRRFALEGVEADLRLGDAESLPFPDESFDVVYSFGVIHHTPDTERALDEIYRVLRKGGTAVLGVYHRYSAFFLIRTVAIYLLNGEWRSESWHDRLSRIEVRSTGNDARPLVKVYSRRALRRRLRRFTEVRTSTHHLAHGDLGPLRHVIPSAWLPALERRLGWYLVASARKPA